MHAKKVTMEKTLVLLVLLIHSALELRAAAQSTATCQALQSQADSASGVMCTRNSQCNELQCGVTETTILQFIRSATLTLLPCNQPAAVRLALYNPSNTVFLNQTIVETTTIQAVDGVISLAVRLDHLTNSIGLGMNGDLTVTIPGFGSQSTTVTILQYTQIPLDTSACLQGVTAGSGSQESATTSSASVTTTTGLQASVTTSSPTSASVTTATDTTSSQSTAATATTSSPTLAQMCQALDNLVDNAQSLSCTKNNQCDTVQCSVTSPTVQAFISTAILMLLPCNQPPAVRLSGQTSSGSVVFDRVITQSQIVPLQQGITLGVTLDQLPNAIGFQANASATVFGEISSITLVPYTEIPIDTSTCSTTTAASTAAMTTSSDTTAATTVAITTRSGTVRRTDKPITDGKPGQAASAGNTLVPGAIVLLLSLLGSRYCTL